MATIVPQKLTINIDGDVYRWSAMGNADTGQAITLPLSDTEVTIQAYGTIGGATLAIEGSLDGSTFATIDDAFGQPMSYTALPKLKPVGPAVLAIRPVTSGGLTTSLTVDIYILRSVRP